MQAIRAARQAAPMIQKRNLTAGSGIGQMLYTNVWKKSTISYVTYILVGCVAIEMVFGSVSQQIWDNANKGVSFIFLANSVPLSHIIFTHRTVCAHPYMFVYG